MTFDIVSYSPAYRADFARLNYAWLEAFFRVEPIDRQVLDNPEAHILEKGGEIFFAVRDGRALGTIALKAMGEGRYELTKLAVDDSVQQGGIGRALCQRVIDRFVEREGGLLFLETNTKLTPAIRLYETLDFLAKPAPCETPYERANYYMEWQGRGLRVREATSKSDTETVKGFFRDYAHWLEGETGLSLDFQGFEAEMAGFPTCYDCLLLARYNSKPIGAVALKRHDETVCEMKRLFVTPSAWGVGAGEALSRAVMAAARDRGFTIMLLDSLRRLQPAVKLYTRLGFAETAPYNENPEADVVYMRCEL